MWLTGVSMTCFAASYAVTLLLEITRLFFRLRIRTAIMIGFMIAGLLAHLVFLWNLAQEEISRGGVAPLSSWYDWCLLAAWVLAAAYLGLALRRPENTMGLFLLPLVLALIGTALLMSEAAPFPRQDALNYWRVVHGMALLVGTVTVLLGFAAGLMYMSQMYRLKRKLPPRQGFNLPSLEWLQNLNKELLFVSTALLALGLLSGIVLNLFHANSVRWNDPVVYSSGVLFAWLTVATLFETLYKPARQGHKVVYLTLASLVFLCLALVFVLMGDHATASRENSWRWKAPAAAAERLANRQPESTVLGGGR